MQNTKCQSNILPGVQLEVGLKTKTLPRMNANEREFHRNHAGMQSCGMCKNDGQKTVIF